MLATGDHAPLPVFDAPPPERRYTRRLTTGCYLISYKPVGNQILGYDGTLRVDASSGPLLASGDLYFRDIVLSDDDPPVEALAPAPDPAAGIPAFPILNYRFYLLVTKLEGAGDNFTLAFET